MFSTNNKYKVNHFVLFLLILMMIIVSPSFNIAMPTYAVAEPLYSGGSGTKNSPYLISTKSDLDALSKFVYSGGETKNKYYKMTNAIDMLNSAFIPIGTMVGSTPYYFDGHFDGNNCLIYNMKIVNSNNANGDIGLFGYLRDPNDNGTFVTEVINVRLQSGQITLTRKDKSAGGIAGSIYKNAKIESCSNIGVSVTCSSGDYSGTNIGGIVGYSDSTSCSIKYCYNTANVTNNCYGTARAGGILGIGSNTINECFNSGTISAGVSNKTSQSYAGGIAGVNAKVNNCYNTGTVKAIAIINTENITYYNNKKDLNNGYYFEYISTGNELKTLAYAGGIVSYSNNVSNCYNIGKISGGYYVKFIDYQKYNVIYDSWQPVNAGTYSIKEITNSQTVYLNYELYSGSIVGICDSSYYMPKNCYSLKNLVTNYSEEYVSPSGKDYFSDFSYYVYIGTGGLHLDNCSASAKVSNKTYTIHFTSETWLSAVWIPTGKTKVNEDIKSYSFSEPYIYNIENENINSNNLGSVWAQNSLINNGYPHLKNIFWINNTQNF